MNKKTYQEAYRIFLTTLQEFEDRAKMKNIAFSNKDIDNLFFKLTNALWEINKVNGKSKTNYCKKGPSDNKFIDCCIDGDVKYLVSSDNHLLELKSLPEIKKYGIKIMTPKEFSLELLRLKFEK